MLPDRGEILRQGGRRGCTVHQEKPRWLHINGHRSDRERIHRVHYNYNVKINK